MHTQSCPRTPLVCTGLHCTELLVSAVSVRWRVCCLCSPCQSVLGEPFR